MRFLCRLLPLQESVPNSKNISQIRNRNERKNQRKVLAKMPVPQPHINDAEQKREQK